MAGPFWTGDVCGRLYKSEKLSEKCKEQELPEDAMQITIGDMFERYPDNPRFRVVYKIEEIKIYQTAKKTTEGFYRHYRVYVVSENGKVIARGKVASFFNNLKRLI